jgi:predicted phosphodiesterase
MNKKFLLLGILLTLSTGATIYFYAFYNITTSPQIISNKNNNIVQNKQHLPELTLAFISDTHENWEVFPTLVTYFHNNPVSLITHLGDQTNYGDLTSLKSAKVKLDSINIKYRTLAGDHDIAQTSSLLNFTKVFSVPETSLIISGLKVTFINNPFNFEPLPDSYLNSVLSSIQDSDIIISSQPIYMDPNIFLSSMYMGSMENLENLSPEKISKLRVYNQQRNLILDRIRSTNKKLLVVSGDHHSSSIFKDPINPLIQYHLVGALAKSIYIGGRELPQKSLQSQRFSVVNIYKEDSKFNFEIKEQIIENLIKSDIN